MLDPAANTMPGTGNRHAKLSRLPDWVIDRPQQTNSNFGIDTVRLSPEEVEYVAALARLGLSDSEIGTMQDQLSSILEHIAAIDELDTEAIPPTAQVIALTSVLRPDAVTGSLPREAVLANAPRQSDGFFEVHAVLGGASEDATE